jgi:hypothetical protein
VATTLIFVSEQDWLDHGHGGGEGLRPMIKSSAAGGVSSGDVLGGSSWVGSRRGPRRRTKALVGWLLYCCTAVAGMAAAWTVRETLFPSLGAPTARSIWEDPTATTITAGEVESESSEGRETAPTVPIPTTVVTTSESSIGAKAGPSASLPGVAPTNSVDNHGSGGGNSPGTGTTVAGNASGNGSGGPGATVDDHGGKVSTSASVPNPPQPTASTPSSVTTDTSSGHQSGKGGSGSGGGGGGGSSSTSTP